MSDCGSYSKRQANRIVEKPIKCLGSFIKFIKDASANFDHIISDISVHPVLKNLNGMESNIEHQAVVIKFINKMISKHVCYRACGLFKTPNPACNNYNFHIRA